MDPVLFISYSHSDNEKHRWRERLTVFLSALGDELPLSVWEDSKIDPGAKYRDEIGAAIAQARAAILLVGPGFLGSKFIKEHELPHLLRAVESGDVNLYPVVVAWCPWEQSDLEPYEAFNDPKAPLESLTESDQNMWLNKLCIALGEDMRRAQVVSPKEPAPGRELYDAMVAIADHLDTTKTAFIAQVRLRNSLVEEMTKRLEITELLEYELFFFRHFEAMNEEERFAFKKIRAYTTGPLHDGNQAILQVMSENPQVQQELPILAALKTHLIVWLNKYDKVFLDTKEMCLVYVGVEDGVPFPTGVDSAVEGWLEEHRA